MTSQRVVLCALGLLVATGVTTSRAQVQPAEVTETVRFPAVVLNPGERVMGFSLTITNAVGVTAITGIPHDWSVALNADLQWQPKVSGACHHGASALESSKDLPIFVLRRVATISKTEPEFSVEGTIDVTTDWEHVTERRLTTKDFLIQK
jgi:hypothetical protein